MSESFSEGGSSDKMDDGMPEVVGRKGDGNGVEGAGREEGATSDGEAAQGEERRRTSEEAGPPGLKERRASGGFVGYEWDAASAPLVPLGPWSLGVPVPSGPPSEAPAHAKDLLANGIDVYNRIVRLLGEDLGKEFVHNIFNAVRGFETNGWVDRLQNIRAILLIPQRKAFLPAHLAQPQAGPLQDRDVEANAVQVWGLSVLIEWDDGGDEEKEEGEKERGAGAGPSHGNGLNLANGANAKEPEGSKKRGRTSKKDKEARAALVRLQGQGQGQAQALRSPSTKAKVRPSLEVAFTPFKLQQPLLDGPVFVPASEMGTLEFHKRANAPRPPLELLSPTSALDLVLLAAASLSFATLQPLPRVLHHVTRLWREERVHVDLPGLQLAVRAMLPPGLKLPTNHRELLLTEAAETAQVNLASALDALPTMPLGELLGRMQAAANRPEHRLWQRMGPGEVARRLTDDLMGRARGDRGTAPCVVCGMVGSFWGEAFLLFCEGIDGNGTAPPEKTSKDVCRRFLDRKEIKRDEEGGPGFQCNVSVHTFCLPKMFESEAEQRPREPLSSRIAVPTHEFTCKSCRPHYEKFALKDMVQGDRLDRVKIQRVDALPFDFGPESAIVKALRDGGGAEPQQEEGGQDGRGRDSDGAGASEEPESDGIEGGAGRPAHQPPRGTVSEEAPSATISNSPLEAIEAALAEGGGWKAIWAHLDPSYV